MTDVLTPEQRRLNMSRIRGRDTKPELLLRRGLHARGLRFRLNRRDLPGCPDLVFPRFRAAIFVHGCFWHGHDCPMFKWPETRIEFWRKKIQGNKQRDHDVQDALAKENWRVLVVWECALRGPLRRPLDDMVNEVIKWFEGNSRDGAIRGAQARGKKPSTAPIAITLTDGKVASH
jgi:DNA mismatch endonuclease (patch repair protein)